MDPTTASRTPHGLGDRLARWAGYIGAAVLTAPVTVVVVLAMLLVLPQRFTDDNDGWILVAVAPVFVAAGGLVCFRRTRPYGWAVLVGLVVLWILTLIVFAGVGDGS